MKNRLKALVLAAGLSLSMVCSCAYAQETEAVTEAATEAVTEAAEAESEAVEETAETEAAQEAPAVPETVTTPDGAYASMYAAAESGLVATLEQLSVLTDEEIQKVIDNPTVDASTLAMMLNWQSSKEELGTFEGAISHEIGDDGKEVTLHTVAKYSNITDNTTVTVKAVYDMIGSTMSIKWDIDYPMGKLMQQAALNTIMGIGIVFLMLLFLSILIGQMHWIPDLLDKKQKAAAPAPAPAPAPAVPVVEEEDLTDDLELVAVITAAIAASENTSSDGFVVRSIKKSNRKKWQNA